jgi:hypothetical protein
MQGRFSSRRGLAMLIVGIVSVSFPVTAISASGRAPSPAHPPAAPLPLPADANLPMHWDGYVNAVTASEIHIWSYNIRFYYLWTEGVSPSRDSYRLYYSAGGILHVDDPWCGTQTIALKMRRNRGDKTFPYIPSDARNGQLLIDVENDKPVTYWLDASISPYQCPRHPKGKLIDTLGGPIWLDLQDDINGVPFPSDGRLYRHNGRTSLGTYTWCFTPLEPVKGASTEKCVDDDLVPLSPPP